MPMQIIKERSPYEYRVYSIEFLYPDHQSGFTFPATRFGDLDMEKMNNPDAMANFKWCMAHPELFDVWNEFHIERRRGVNPAVGRCSCGQEVELYSEYMGACQCPKCGRWYNVFGQALVDPEYWEEDDGEDETW